MPPLWLLTIITRTGIPSRFAKVAAWLVAALMAATVIALLFAAFHSWLASERTDAVTLDRADISAEVTNRVLAADHSANANAAAAEAVARDNEKEIDREASRNDGTATAGVLAKLREQQQAGRR